MYSSFQQSIKSANSFTITMELVPKAESSGRSTDMVLNLAENARKDGRLSAVTITDNPGGNPSLSPDALGKEILEMGMDVIVHFTCRDTNRAGIESRALQLRRMGLNNILALTGDYSGKGFGGQGSPVFDLDSVSLLCLLKTMNHKALKKGDNAPFFSGCAVSPFKYTEPECYTQYYKLFKKVFAGAQFAITQLGYDVRKYQELIQFSEMFELKTPLIASIYMLTPKSSRVMNSGRVPGTVVNNKMNELILSEWVKGKREGYFKAVERTAKLSAVLKGIGYAGIHLGGVHRNFITIKRIIDGMEKYEKTWEAYLPEFQIAQPENSFYIFTKNPEGSLSENRLAPRFSKAKSLEKAHYKFLAKMHEIFFRFDAPYSDLYARICKWLIVHRKSYQLFKLVEKKIKKQMLSCHECGDCAIQHAGFLCPESKCPKHTRNGPCGGSCQGMCEVHKDRYCVWYLAYKRMAIENKTTSLAKEFVPPRKWELNKTSSWVNFHLRKDHQGALDDMAKFCSGNFCVKP